MNANKFIKVVPKVQTTASKSQMNLQSVPKGASLITFDPYMAPALMTPEMVTCAISHFMILAEKKKKPHVIRFVRPEHKS